MKKKKNFILILILTVLLLTGCYDSLNVDDQAYVFSMGMDYGRQKKYLYTFQLTKFGVLTDDPKERVFNFCVEANGIYEAIDYLNASTPAKMNFTHLNYIIFSQELAKDDVIKSIVSPFPRLLRVRQTIDMFIAKDSAQSFLLGMEDVIFGNYAKMQRNLVTQQEFTGLYPKTTLTNYYEASTSGTYDCIVPIGSYNINMRLNEQSKENEEQSNGNSGDDKKNMNDDLGIINENIKELNENGIQYSTSEKPYILNAGQMQRSGGLATEIYGCAIFKDTKMVGELNGEQTQMVLIGRGDFNYGFFSIQDEEGDYINWRVKQKYKPKIKFELPSDPNGKIKIAVDIILEGDVYRDDRNDNEGLMPFDERVDINNDTKEIEKFFIERLNIITALCQKLKTDLFGFGNNAVKNFKYVQEWETFLDEDKLYDAEILWKVKFIATANKKIR